MKSKVLVLATFFSMGSMAGIIDSPVDLQEQENTLTTGDIHFNAPSLDDNIKLVAEFGIATKHFDENYIDYDIPATREFNEDNKVIGFGVRSGSLLFALSTFENSFYNRSYMATIEHNLLQVYDFNFDVSISVVNGYDEKMIDGDFFVNDAMIVPLISIRYSPDFLSFGDFQISPKLRFMGAEAYMFNMEVEYKI